ncbi:MAG: restriction endonuclease subunit S [Marinomonas sp.]|uniref:restriction endonuclease subunit S n=1 Tax=Marinomonas sp. TaxID=1904862 RepID=UPI003F9AE6E1
MSSDFFPNSWRFCPLEDVMDAIIDYRGKTPKKTEAGIPLVTAKIVKDGYVQTPTEFIAEDNYETWMVRGLPEVGDVVLTTEAPLGEAAQLTDSNIALAQRIVTLRGKKGVLSNDYLLCAMQSNYVQHQLEARATGSTVKGIKQSELRKVILPVPPSEEQQRISNILKSISDKILLNSKINQTLEQTAQAIFKSWFVDFDPVKAKIETLAAGGSAYDAELAAMSVISAKPLDELNSLKASNPKAFNKLAQTTALFPAAMQDSELGDIPEGWEVSEIGSEVTVVGGGTPSTKNTEFWEDGTIHWTTPKDMSGLSCKVLTRTDRKITELGLKKISSGLLSENTVLMSSRAPVGYLALAKIPVAINQGYIAMKCGTRLPPEYVLLWCEHNMDEIKQRASGTTFAEISKANFKPIPAIVPTISIVDAFSVQISEIYNFVHNNVLQSETLSISRDLLLPKLLSGELSDFFMDGE